jgi:hypothetical protein
MGSLSLGILCILAMRRAGQRLVYHLGHKQPPNGNRAE